MRKLVWNLDKTVAIPISNVKCFEISTRVLPDGEKYFVVIAMYVIAIGDSEKVFMSNDKEQCEKFIESCF